MDKKLLYEDMEFFSSAPMVELLNDELSQTCSNSVDVTPERLANVPKTQRGSFVLKIPSYVRQLNILDTLGSSIRGRRILAGYYSEVFPNLCIHLQIIIARLIINKVLKLCQRISIRHLYYHDIDVLATKIVQTFPELNQLTVRKVLIAVHRQITAK